MNKSLKKLRNLERRMYPLEMKLSCLKELKIKLEVLYKIATLRRNKSEQLRLDEILCNLSRIVSITLSKLTPLQCRYNHLQGFMQGKYLAMAA